MNLLGALLDGVEEVHRCTEVVCCKLRQEFVSACRLLYRGLSASRSYHAARSLTLSSQCRRLFREWMTSPNWFSRLITSIQGVAPPSTVFIEAVTARTSGGRESLRCLAQWLHAYRTPPPSLSSRSRGRLRTSWFIVKGGREQGFLSSFSTNSKQPRAISL